MHEQAQHDARRIGKRIPGHSRGIGHRACEGTQEGVTRHPGMFVHGYGASPLAVSGRGGVSLEWNGASYGGVPSSRTSGNSIFRAPEKRETGRAG